MLYHHHRSRGFTLVEMMVVVMIFAILVLIVITNYKSSVSFSQTKSCVVNLKQIQAAKELFFMSKSDKTVTDNDLFGTDKMIRVKPTCPTGAVYDIGKTQQKDPTCSSGNDDHVLPD